MTTIHPTYVLTDSLNEATRERNPSVMPFLVTVVNNRRRQHAFEVFATEGEAQAYAESWKLPIYQQCQGLVLGDYRTPNGAGRRDDCLNKATVEVHGSHYCGVHSRWFKG